MSRAGNIAGDVANAPPASGAANPNGLAHRACQELWFALAKRDWNSVVLVPIDPDGPAAHIGKSLAELGTKLSDIPVTFMSVSSLQCESAFVLADLQQHIRRVRGGPIAGAPIISVTAAPVPEMANSDDEPPKPTATSAGTLAFVPCSRLVISIPPVILEPLGLAATQNADAIVLVIEMKRTRIADARRTIELIGRERIAGCVTVT